MFEFNPNFKEIRGEILTLDLVEETIPQDSSQLPFYCFDLRHNASNRLVGNMVIRIGSNLGSTYEGNIDIDIYDEFRGHRYGCVAIEMVFEIFRHHGMDKAILSCAETNFPSRRVIELMGGQLIEVTSAPVDVALKNPTIHSYAIYSLKIPPVNYLKTIRNEHYAMAIAFFENKILCLRTKDGKLTLPKCLIEVGESSFQACTRECLEQTGVMLIKEDWIKEINSIDYSFTHQSMRNMTPLQFYATFGVSKIHKNVKVHVFQVDDELEVKELPEDSEYKEICWLPIEDFLVDAQNNDILQAVFDALSTLEG